MLQRIHLNEIHQLHCVLEILKQSVHMQYTNRVLRRHFISDIQTHHKYGTQVKLLFSGC